VLVRGTLLVAMAAAVTVAVAGAGSFAWRESGRLLRDPAPSGLLAVADPGRVAIIDGGTLRIDQRVVRLLGVDPPARGESCGRQADCGSAAANALAGLVADKPVSCALHGADPLGRPLALCDAAGKNLNRAVIAAGWARADDDLPELVQAERGAREDRRGLWSIP
jgi:endonuclease YncB( thermonuclease family)